MKNKIRKRERIIKELIENLYFLPGSLYMLRGRCGKEGCRCERGEWHERWYVSYTKGGRTRMVYVPKKRLREAEELVRRWKRVRELMGELKEINAELFSEGWEER